MHRYKAFGLNIDSEIVLPELSEGDPQSEVDLTIKKGEVILPETAPTRIFRRSTEAHFGQDIENNLYLTWNNIASFKAISGDILIVSPQNPDHSIISLFTVSEALGLILFQRGYFLLHASSVLVGDEAWCFMGEPGAGKSTTAAAFIKAGCKLLSDDLTAIRMDQNGVAHVIPAYPQLKIWENTVNGLAYDQTTLQPVSEGVRKFAYHPTSTFSHGAVKLGKVFFLHKTGDIQSPQPLLAGDIPTQLLIHFPLPTALLVGEALKRHFMQSMQCGKSAEMWRMKRPEGFANLESWVSECISKSVINE
ncbi:serine kinase [Dyadobacter luticola]|uniref:Serine kinase n=1 Tax=Dyadobacter luticola TaxID=1979387 RepID=A0A5R9KYH4_9BACT|nr:serine kinase [Dyadobacter luticola]TLV01169.1 serine kinase [Dyadobacter luticola]